MKLIILSIETLGLCLKLLIEKEDSIVKGDRTLSYMLSAEDSGSLDRSSEMLKKSP